MSKPNVCIIGAGISGLTAGKMLTDYDIPYQCFDTSDRLGGNWAFGNPNGHSSAYQSLHIDTSKSRLSFKDFSIPKDLPDFPHHTDIKRYLDDYADAFALRERIHFENGVDHAARTPGGGWTVTTQDGEHRSFDFLVVANGHHWDPRYPSFPGTFTGESIHSHQYIDPETPLHLRDKRILVVGIGNSAADIAVELSQRSHRNQVTISTRSGAWVVPKYAFGVPADTLSETNPQIPLSWQRRLARISPFLLSGRPERFGLPTPDHHFGDAHPTQSQELLLRLGSGDIDVEPNIDRLDGENVHFVDGGTRPYDTIIYATGYNITFPFFDEDFLSAPNNRLPLYKRMFKPGIVDLAFIGFAQAIPTLFPFVECQSRTLAAHLAGTYRLPPEAEMHRVIASDQARFVGHFNDRPRHTQQVDYYIYEHEMRTKELPAGLERAHAHGPTEFVHPGR